MNAAQTLRFLTNKGIFTNPSEIVMKSYAKIKSFPQWKNIKGMSPAEMLMVLEWFTNKTADLFMNGATNFESINLDNALHLSDFEIEIATNDKRYSDARSLNVSDMLINNFNNLMLKIIWVPMGFHWKDQGEHALLLLETHSTKGRTILKLVDPRKANEPFDGELGIDVNGRPYITFRYWPGEGKINPFWTSVNGVLTAYLPLL
jgi:hypothetical protein